MSTDDSMNGARVIPDEIRALLEQRSTFQEWLGRLDDLGSEFRAEVSEKVRSDYTERLSRVETELEGHRTELEATLLERRAAVADVSERHEARSAELEEAELRYRVGEFDEKQWEQRRADQQAALDELAADLSVHSTAVAALEAVLDELAGRATPAPSVRPESASESQLAEAVEVGESVAVITGDEVDAEAPEESDVIEESEIAGEPEVAGEPEIVHEPEPAEELEAAEDKEAPGESEAAAAWATRTSSAEASEVAEDVVPGTGVEETEAADAEARRPSDESLRVETAAETGDDEARTPEPEEEPVGRPEEPAEFMDELEFLESLSLDDADTFDAVSAMLDEEEEDPSESDRKAEDL